MKRIAICFDGTWNRPEENIGEAGQAGSQHPRTRGQSDLRTPQR